MLKLHFKLKKWLITDICQRKKIGYSFKKNADLKKDMHCPYGIFGINNNMY